MVKLILSIVAAATAAFSADSRISGTWVGTWNLDSARSDQVCLSLSDKLHGLQGYLTYDGDAKYVEVTAESTTDDSAVAFEVSDNNRGPIQLTFFRAGENLAGRATLGDRSDTFSLRNYTPPASYFRYGGIPSKPTLIFSTPPEYTSQARIAKVQGKVTLFVSIQASGAVGKQIDVIHGLGFGLDEKAIECVAKWRFSPPRLDCQPVHTHTLINVEFHQ